MRGRKGIRTKEMLSIAKERIDILFRLAEEEGRKKNFKRANRYVNLARKIGMRYNVRIPKEFRLRMCKHCSSYLLPPMSCRVRLQRKHIAITCLNCNTVTRRPFLKEMRRWRSRRKAFPT